MEREKDAFLNDIVKEIVGLLVVGQFDLVEEMTKGIRLTARDMESAIRDYGATLIDPPEIAFNNIDAIQIKGANPPSWSVRFDLWTREEGQSDLSLELTIEKGLVPRVEVDDLHVL